MVLAARLAIRFIMEIFKRIGSKDAITGVIDKAEDGIGKAADGCVKFYRNKTEERKQKKKEKEEKPIVTIR